MNNVIAVRIIRNLYGIKIRSTTDADRYNLTLSLKFDIWSGRWESKIPPRKTIIPCTQGVTNSPDHCVRFLFDKRCHTSQRQPMRPLETNTNGESTTEPVVLNNPLLPVVNGGYVAGQARLHLAHI
jgi:hypothetical protein